MITLSVVIITFNEEKNIGRCLDSLQGIADEIVVVDSFSTDQTEQICLRYQARFIRQTFLGYIEQKNFALSQATHPYALSLDADECLSDELRNQIQLVKNAGFTFDAYSMNRCTSFCGRWIRHGSWYPDTKIRLINKSTCSWGGTNPHDRIITATTSTIHHLKGDLLHYSYYSLEEVITQNNKFTSIQANAMYAQGKKASYFKLVLNPFVAFISGYIFKRGFLDGTDGFFIASSVAYQTMVKYAKLLKLQKQDHSKLQ